MLFKYSNIFKYLNILHTVISCSNAVILNDTRLSLFSHGNKLTPNRTSPHHQLLTIQRVCAGFIFHLNRNLSLKSSPSANVTREAKYQEVRELAYEINYRFEEFSL